MDVQYQTRMLLTKAEYKLYLLYKRYKKGNSEVIPIVDTLFLKFKRNYAAM